MIHRAAKSSLVPSDIRETVLRLTCLLPFLVPFSLGQNIDLQSIILILIGAVAWYNIWLGRKAKSRLPLAVVTCVVIYVGCCALNLLTHPSFDTFFGTTMFRLGIPGLVACIGCGLALQGIQAKRLLVWLYATCVLLAATTIPYTLWTAGHISRPGGVFHQADFLGVWMGCGLILGCGLWQAYPAVRRWLIPPQILLVSIMALSQTRAVLVLLPIVGLVMIAQIQTSWQRRIALAGSMILVITLAVLSLAQLFPNNRVTDTAYSSESIQYRLSLQSFGAKASLHRPVLGFGAGNVSTALACLTLHNAALQKTCHEGHYFDSSHNIFLDRFIALGWVGGAAFLLFVALSLLKGLRRLDMERYFVYCALLLSLYYCTNVTSVSIELLLWVCLWRAWVKHEV